MIFYFNFFYIITLISFILKMTDILYFFDITSKFPINCIETIEKDYKSFDLHKLKISHIQLWRIICELTGMDKLYAELIGTDYFLGNYNKCKYNINLLIIKAKNLFKDLYCYIRSKEYELETPPENHKIQLDSNQLKSIISEVQQDNNEFIDEFWKQFRNEELAMNDAQMELVSPNSFNESSSTENFSNLFEDEINKSSEIKVNDISINETNNKSSKRKINNETNNKSSKRKVNKSSKRKINDIIRKIEDISNIFSYSDSDSDDDFLFRIEEFEKYPV